MKVVIDCQHALRRRISRVGREEMSLGLRDMCIVQLAASNAVSQFAVRCGPKGLSLRQPSACSDLASFELVGGYHV